MVNKDKEKIILIEMHTGKRMMKKKQKEVYITQQNLSKRTLTRSILIIHFKCFFSAIHMQK